MAFNHVGECSCPVGCCDCGTNYEFEAERSKVLGFQGTITPHDLYMNKTTEELVEIKRNIDYSSWNMAYIGEIEESIDHDDVIVKLSILDNFIDTQTKGLSKFDKINFLWDFARDLADCVNPKSRKRTVEAVNSFMAKKFERVTTDWKPIF